MHMGWKNGKKYWENVFWVLPSPDIWKIVWDIEQTQSILAHPFLILASLFNGKSIYHVPKYEPPLVCSSTLNYLQFTFFQLEVQK